MTITVKSKIEKGLIRLPKRVRLPDGTRVIVKIEPILKTKEKLKIISDLSGSWSDDPTIMPIFEDLEQKRHHNFGREVGFEVCRAAGVPLIAYKNKALRTPIHVQSLAEVKEIL